jgi:hypothetical protein
MVNDQAEPPFRLTFFLVSGQEWTFPYRAENARDDIDRATKWDSAPFTPQITQALDDRELFAWAVLRLHTHMARRGGGTFYVTDDHDNDWGIPARYVVAVRVEDPSKPDRPRTKQIGFTFQRDEREEPSTSG